MTDDPIPQLHGSSRRISFPLLLAILIGAEFATALETGMIYTALAKLYGIYGDPAHVTWLITAYSLSAAGGAVLFSRLGDIYGRARMFKMMLGCAAVGSTISALATDLDVIILGRLLQGVSMAILPLAFGILREHAADSRQLNFGVGLLGGTYSFSIGIGYFLSGVIVDNFDWQHIFSVSAVAATVMLVLAVAALHDRPRGQAVERIDWVGASFIVPITALLLGLTFSRTMGWSSSLVIGLMVLGLVSLVLWARHELRHTNPLVDVRLLANPTIAIVNAAIFFTAMAPMIYPQVIMPLLQQPTWTGIGLGVSATVAGLLKLPTNASSGTAAIIVGVLARRYSMRPAVIAAAAANLCAFVALIFWQDSMWLIAALCVLLVAPASTVMFACAPGLIMEAAPADRTSEATGLSAVIRAIASAIGTQLLAFALASSAVTNSEGVSFPDERAYIVTFATIAGACLLSFIFALMIPRVRMPVVARNS